MVWKRFLVAFDLERFSEIYGSYFDNGHVTVYQSSVLQSRDNCH